MSLQLSPTEVRIIGCLVEKESTTPDVYPLSLNALVAACNQTSNRDPVMLLKDDSVRWAINSLRQQSLVRAIQPADSRVMKYQHLLIERLGVDKAELAVLGVLLLRGAQTVAELRTRTQRMVVFEGAADVEGVLGSLGAKGVVAVVARRAGQKEVRYVQLLEKVVAEEAGAEVESVSGDREGRGDRGARDGSAQGVGGTEGRGIHNVELSDAPREVAGAVDANGGREGDNATRVEGVLLSAVRDASVSDARDDATRHFADAPNGAVGSDRATESRGVSPAGGRAGGGTEGSGGGGTGGHEERIAALEAAIGNLRKELADLAARFAEFRRLTE